MPIFLIPFGVAMIATAVFGKKKRPEETYLVKTPELLLPSTWDQAEITHGMERYEQHRGLLSPYIDGLVSRFVMNQDIKTIRIRTEFLEQFNRSAAVAREAYKWQRYLQGDRAKDEEDAADLAAKVKVRKAQQDLDALTKDRDIADLEKQVAVRRLRLELATLQKQLDDLDRPPPAPPPPPQSARETREMKKRATDLREQEVFEAIRAAEADTRLSQEQRQRKLNALHDRLEKIQEERIELI